MVALTAGQVGGNDDPLTDGTVRTIALHDASNKLVAERVGVGAIVTPSNHLDIGCADAAGERGDKQVTRPQLGYVLAGPRCVTWFARFDGSHVPPPQ